MTRSDDEQTPGSDGHDDVAALVRASLHGAAAHTPIGADRLHEIRVSAVRRPSLGWLQIAASVVAIAAIAGIVAVLQGGHGSANSSVRTGGGGSGDPASVVSSSPAVTSPVTSPTSVTGTPTPSASHVPDPCNPENYYVTASRDQVRGLTYLLDQTPAGYQMYGAWGTISRTGCIASATWYVEYDKSSDATTNISISVRPAPAGPIQFPDGVDVTVQGHPARLLGKDGAYGILLWQAGGVDIQLSGPITGGSGQDALITLANTLSPVALDDPRIVAPAKCQVPPGSTCPSSTDSPTPTSSDSPSANPTLSATPTPSPTPTASPGG